MNPFLAFCLYVSARVFVQYLKSRKEDSAVKSSLHFLLAAMQVLKTKNPLTESFLVQLDVDLEGSGLEIPSHSRYKFGRRPPGEVPVNTDTVNCIPLFEIRESQSVGQTNRENGGDTTQEQPPEWAKNGTTPSYPGMIFPEQRVAPGDGRDPHNKMDHLQPISSFDGQDMLYGQASQQRQSSGPSPGFAGTESSGSHSNHPTPASSSQRGGSYTGQSPYQQSNHAFSPPTNTNSSDRAFPEQIVFGAQGSTNFGTVPNNMATSWNFKSHHSNSDTNSNANPQAQLQQQNLQQQQQPQGQPNDFNFGGTGLTPGATGMTPLPDSLWQSVMDSSSDWMQGWTPSAQ